MFEKARRQFLLKSLLFTSVPMWPTPIFARPRRNLLDPDRLRNFRIPQRKSIVRGNSRISYVDFGPPNGPTILYFHGWRGGYAAVLPREYILTDAGFRVLIPNRPGYDGSDLDLGKTARDAADMGRHLLDSLSIKQAIVLGTSGGGPAALAFADLYNGRTRALVLQCAVTRPWADLDHVPRIFQTEFADYKAGRMSKGQFVEMMGNKLSELQSKDLVELLKISVGKRLANVQNDPAFAEFFRTLARGDSPNNKHGEINDVMEIFLSGSEYFTGNNIKCPTWIIHDTEDPFVTHHHAAHAHATIRGSRLVGADGGHFIWLGSESVKLKSERVPFLRRV